MDDTLRFPNKSHRFSFEKPGRSSLLAEFCGIMLGDGGIAHYQASITLHSITDSRYADFVLYSITQLFGIQPRIYKRKTSHAITIVISRISVVEFLVNECGWVKGNKIAQNVDIPKWIKETTEYSITCVRGLFDTDGSVFVHRYVSKGREYRYKKLSFTSVSIALLCSVFEILTYNKIKVRFGSRYDIRIDSKSDVERYFRVIGSNNPKHLNRYAS